MRPKQVVLLILSATFIVGGFSNNGVSWFLPAVPFAILFLYQLTKSPRKQAAWILIVTLVISVLVGWNHPRNHLLYPVLGSEIFLKSGWGYSRFMGENNYYLVSPVFIHNQIENEIAAPENYTNRLVMIEKATRLTMAEVKVSHADLGTTLYAMFRGDDGNLYELSEQVLFESIEKGDIESQDLAGIKNIQSRWTSYLGLLMAWPLTPMILGNVFSSHDV